jgi:YD repeat-containing protein
LLETVTGPRPGTTGGAQTVTTTYTYDALGNALTQVAPGNPDNQTTTYNYTSDGAYSQSPALGQPLTVTDNLGNVSHFRYDSRGNVIWASDPLGHATDFTYNLADQLSTKINPATP